MMSDQITSAAGILFITAAGEVLLLKRGAGGDYPGAWCFPGGTTELGETSEQTAMREATEELGFLPPGERRLWTRRIADGVDFTTFIQQVPGCFAPRLNGEHTDYRWVTMTDLNGAVGIRADAEFREEDHPRAADGKFGSGGGRKSLTPAETTGEGKERKHSAAGGKSLPAHIEKIKIPPGWTDVHYSDDPDADLLAVGRDSKGRPQSIYSEKFAGTQAATKFARIHELIEKFGKIRDQNNEARKSGNPRIKDSADCLALVMHTGIRPGSDDDTGAKVKAYGATTLEGRHVVQTENGTSLRFVGKKGVALDIPVNDPEIAAMLKERASSAGQDGKLFAATSDKSLLDHVHTLDGGGFKSKDFRTHVGTTTAYELVRKSDPPKTETEYKKRVMDVAKVVSKRLGNTPTVALQSYISPTVFAEWKAAL